MLFVNRLLFGVCCLVFDVRCGLLVVVCCRWCLMLDVRRVLMSVVTAVVCFCW